MYLAEGVIKRAGTAWVRCVSVLLIAALCLMNVPLSFAFTSDNKATFSASVTIGSSSDTDYDGIPDSWEIANGLDPSDPDDIYYDFDNDGINNLEEYRLGTSPNTSNSGIIATLSASPSSGFQPVDITFTAGSNSGSIVKYEWDFDGSGTYDQWCYASEGNTVTHRYAANGTYNVKMRATDSMGNAGVAVKTVTINRNNALSPPTASPILNLATIPIVTVLRLNGTAFDNETVVRYQWDTTGNGEYDISSTKSVDISRTYNETVTRSFDARLKVTDTDGLSDIATVGIETDASSWNDSPNRPRIYLDNYVVYGNAGVPVELGGYCTPQVGYAKKLEWDFEADGICDWSSSVDNSDWTGKADTTHIYGAPGIYRAVLKGHTEAHLSATDSVLVVISSNGTPPKAQGLVTYNGISNAKEIVGIIPVKAEFSHSLSTGSIVKYEWDFDGDKRIDYTTTSSADIATYDYQFPGPCVAILKVTDINGLIDTFYIPVFSAYPAGYASYIKLPTEDKVVAGNNITVVSEVFPDDSGVNSVMFQYRRVGDATWTDIGAGIPIMSYLTTWDTTGLVDGAAYQLRAIVNGADTSSFKTTSVVVNNSIPNPDIYEYKNGTHTKRVKIDPSQSTFVVLPDGTHIEIPYGAIPDDGSMPEIVIEEVLDLSAGVGGAVEINIIGTEKFLKDITISIPYPDENDDGIVDGTNLDEKDLVVKWFNPQTGEWERLYDSVVYPDQNFISAKINHLSLFGIGSIAGAAAAAGAAGGAGSSLSKTASYCFIATAAYGSPDCGDVMILRHFRDRYLMTNRVGRSFVRSYYRYSPAPAEFIKDRPVLKRIVRFMLKPLVRKARMMLGRRSGGEVR